MASRPAALHEPRPSTVPPQSVADPHQRASRYSQASRQIYEIADVEHAETARLILEGPMQRLADAALEAELIGRSSASEPVVQPAPAPAAGPLLRGVGAAWGGHRRTLPLTEDRGLLGRSASSWQHGPGGGTVLLHVLGSERHMPALAEITMYRILEQALDNALAHGSPERVDAIISFLPRMVVGVVKDDGDGFDVNATDARMGRTAGLGLIQMRERAALVGGRVQVRSGLGLGTEVRVTIPDSRATT